MAGELEKVERAAEKLRAAQEARDAAIVAAIEAGESLRAVARAAGVSHQTVANVVA